MRDISLESPAGAIPYFTFLNYGDTRSGKTWFAATFPRPFIFADVIESGYKSIKTMDRDQWFEPDVAPIIRGVENMGDVANEMPKVDALIAQGRVHTLVFDAFSFYTDFFLAQLLKLQTKPDNRQAYGQLGVHLREIRTTLHSRGKNVVWSCLAKHPETEDPKGRPMIPGQQSDKFSAGVDFLFHSRVEQKREGGKIVSETRELRTRQYNSYIAGHREGIYSNSLPDPFVGNYADFIAALGFDVDAIRKTIKQPQKPVVQAPKPAAVTRPAPKVVPTPAINNPASRGAIKQ